MLGCGLSGRLLPGLRLSLGGLFSGLLSGPFGLRRLLADCLLAGCFSLCRQLNLLTSGLLALSRLTRLTGRLCQRFLAQGCQSRGIGLNCCGALSCLTLGFPLGDLSLRRCRALSSGLPLRFLLGKCLAFNCLTFGFQPNCLDLPSGDLLAGHGLTIFLCLSRLPACRRLRQCFLPRCPVTSACLLGCLLSGHLRCLRLRGHRLLQGRLPGGVLQRQHFALLDRPLRCVLPLNLQPVGLRQRRLFAQRLLLTRLPLFGFLTFGVLLRQSNLAGILARCTGSNRFLPLRFKTLTHGLRGCVVGRLLSSLLGGDFRLGLSAYSRRLGSRLQTFCGCLQGCLRRSLLARQLLNRFAQGSDRDGLRQRQRQRWRWRWRWWDRGLRTCW